jgi:hypothetical protein
LSAIFADLLRLSAKDPHLWKGTGIVPNCRKYLIYLKNLEARAGLEPAHEGFQPFFYCESRFVFLWLAEWEQVIGPLFVHARHLFRLNFLDLPHSIINS